MNQIGGTLPAIRQEPDADLDQHIITLWTATLVALGYQNSFTGDDVTLLARSMRSTLVERYPNFTKADIKLAFRAGSRGDYRTDKKEKIFPNLPTVLDWMEAYYEEKRRRPRDPEPQVLEPAEPLPFAHPAQWLPTCLYMQQQLDQQATAGYYWDFDLGNVIFDRLRELGLIAFPIDRLKDELKKAAERVVAEGAPMWGYWMPDEYAAFASCLKENLPLPDGYYKRVAVGYAKKVLMKEFVEGLQKDGFKITYLVAAAVGQDIPTPGKFDVSFQRVFSTKKV